MGKELVLATVRENPKLPHEISIPLGRLIRFCCNHKSTSHEATFPIRVDTQAAQKVSDDCSVQVGPFWHPETKRLATVDRWHADIDTLRQFGVGDQRCPSARIGYAVRHFRERDRILVCVRPRALQ